MAYLGYGLGYNGLADSALGAGLGYPGLGYPGLGYGLGYGGLWGGGGGAGLANIATTERFGLAVGNEVQNFGCANLVATERNYGLLSSSFERGVGSINTNAQLIANQQALQAAQNDAANANRAKDIQVQLLGSTSALALQISDSKNQIQKDIADSQSALALLTVQKTNELALQAEKNNCHTNAHISEGFCNTNKNIADSENAILAAINTNETSRLKEALAYANTVNLINRSGHHHHHHTVGNFF